MAIKDAGLNLDKIDKERLGIVLGTGIGGLELWKNSLKL